MYNTDGVIVSSPLLTTQAVKASGIPADIPLPVEL